MKANMVRDTRQQMERGGPEEADSSDTTEGETATGGEALCPLNNYQNVIRGKNVWL